MLPVFISVATQVMLSVVCEVGMIAKYKPACYVYSSVHSTNNFYLIMVQQRLYYSKIFKPCKLPYEWLGRRSSGQ